MQINLPVVTHGLRHQAVDIFATASYEKERLQKLLEENLTDEEASELDDNDESDQESDREERQDTDSESEQDISGVEEEVTHSESFTYMGKDKLTRWKKHTILGRTVKTRKETIVKRWAKIWEYFFNDNITGHYSD
ncbi:hypothetical protein QE152_g17001 [Popillia japonica]|uniref:Uncharacterized protein n=1 Tax=Popillia japonica TaxID=7064 RepID=A0AAW1L5C1_POPJA